MSMISSTAAPGYAATRESGTIAAAVKRVYAAYIAWRMRQAALATLRSMSERELRDIGLARSEIDHAVQSEAARDRTVACEW